MADSTFALPASSTVPQGSGGNYAKKYVRVPVDVQKHQIIPAASDAASQALIINGIPKSQRFTVYHQYLSRFIRLAGDIYRHSQGDTKVTAQGILAEAQGHGMLPGAKG